MTKFSKSAIVKMGAACLAFGLILSSCSKEEAQVAPEARVEKVSEANKKIDPPFVFPTYGTVGIGKHPEIWSLDGDAYGISNSKYLFGNTRTPWQKPFPMQGTGSTSFVTLKVVNESVSGNAFTDVGNLVPGKKYKLSFKVAVSYLQQGLSLLSDPKATVMIYDFLGTQEVKKEIHFGGKSEQWIDDSIVFTAASPKAVLSFEMLNTKPANQLAFNIHVGNNAIQEVNY